MPGFCSSAHARFAVCSSVLCVFLAMPGTAQTGAKNGEWRTYGGDLGNTRYSPLDQINASNFNKLQIAWRFSTANLGPRPEYNLEATPLMIGGVVYSVAGSRRDVVALDATTGELLWVHGENEGLRGDDAPRRLSGRGLSYWTDGREQRILYVTPGYRLIALDAKSGNRIPSFGNGGEVDLKLQDDQEIDLVTGEVGLHSAPLLPATQSSSVPHIWLAAIRNQEQREGLRPRIRREDRQTALDLPYYPEARRIRLRHLGERFRRLHRNTGSWGQMSVDEELGLAYIPVELPTGDYYGGHRPGNGLFGESIVAVDLKTGVRKWHYQLVHHGIWDWIFRVLPCWWTSLSMAARSRPWPSRLSSRSYTFLIAPPASPSGR